MARSERAIRNRDFVVAVVNVTMAVTTASSIDGTQLWSLAAPMFGASVLLFAVADRTDLGNWALGIASSAAVVVVVLALWWVGSGSLLSLIPPVLLGLGLGTAANRLLFGVVYPLPEARLRRENPG